MNLFWREMKANRKSLIIWSIGVIMMVASGMSKYGTLNGDVQSMNDLIEQMPKALQAIMGAGSFDLSTAMGYYGLLFLYLVMMATIHAVMLGANIIAKEERDKTVEFLIVKPISRTQVVTSKLTASVVNLIIFNLVTFASSIGMVQYYSDGDEIFRDISVLMLGMFILQLLFLAIGSAIAAVKKKSKAAASISTAVLLLTFILSVAIDLNENLEGLKYFTPFKYYEAKHIIGGGGFDAVFVVISVLLIAGLSAVTFSFYKKKDLNI